MAKKRARKNRRSSRSKAAASKTVRAYVYLAKDDNGTDTYRVYPGVVILQGGDDLELVNVSGDEATWTAPAGPFGGGFTEKVKNNNGKNKKASAGPMAAQYQVEVKGKKAHGNSDPVIIIDL